MQAWLLNGFVEGMGRGKVKAVNCLLKRQSWLYVTYVCRLDTPFRFRFTDIFLELGECV